jgi:peptidoglycan L-alanyl-D-glutamate endopeptidase CwlK
MSFELSQKSKDLLEKVRPELRRVILRAAAISSLRFVVTEGIRSLARQQQLVAMGASRTMNSRHLTGHAVDLAVQDENGKIRWDWPLYHKLAAVVKQAAGECATPIEWGGDWRSFKDGPHFQLPRKEFP